MYKKLFKILKPSLSQLEATNSSLGIVLSSQRASIVTAGNFYYGNEGWNGYSWQKV